MPQPPLSPERWRRIDDLFSDTVALPPPEREPYLLAQCGEDAELLREVRALLATEESADLHIPTMVGKAASTFSEAQSDADIGLELGPYRLAERIGTGGMGAVFKAFRTDAAFTHPVAVKLVRPGMHAGEILGRFFRREQRILGSLNHPNIARILDAGSAPDGRPYFVMEYVDGLPLHVHAGRFHLDVRSRAELFAQICAAVQHAHQKLIIHRDLKPSNILVTADGVPKLLDFGIAKVLQSGDVTDEQKTQTVGRFLTPDYASPEQVMGGTLTTATDVYSLGAVFYELLAGRRPFSGDSRPVPEIERAIVFTEPVPPSAAAADARLARQLAGELDNIVLMAMRKEPERRYASVEQLAADVRNYLDGRPVVARKSTLGYRIRKHVTRNKAATIAAALLLVSLVGGILATSYQARRAERRFQQVRKLANTFLFDFYKSIENAPGTVEARALVLRTAREYLDSLAAEASGDRTLARELAVAYLRLGEVEGHAQTGNLGRSATSTAHFEKALALLEPLATGAKPDPACLRTLALLHSRIADNIALAGKMNEAEAHYGKALALRSTLVARLPQSIEDLSQLGDVYRSLGNLQNRMLKSGPGLENQLRGVEISERLMAMQPGNRRLRNRLASSYTTTGVGLQGKGQLGQARALLEKAVHLREALFAADPEDQELRHDLIIAYSNLADVLGSPFRANLGDVPGAIAIARRMVALAEQSAREDAADQRGRFDYAMSLSRLAALLPSGPGPDEGLAAFRKSQGIYQDLARADPANLRTRAMVSFTETQIGKRLEAAGDREGAIRTYRAAAAADAAQLGIRDIEFTRYSNFLQSHTALGEALARSGRCPQAVEPLRQAAERSAPLWQTGAREFRVLMAKQNLYRSLGSVEATCGNREEARAAFEQSLAAWDTLAAHPGFEPKYQADIQRVRDSLDQLTPRRALR